MASGSKPWGSITREFVNQSVTNGLRDCVSLKQILQKDYE